MMNILQFYPANVTGTLGGGVRQKEQGSDVLLFLPIEV